MKKRFLALLLGLCMTASLAGCGLAATQAPATGGDPGADTGAAGADLLADRALGAEGDINLAVDDLLAGFGVIADVRAGDRKSVV